MRVHRAVMRLVVSGRWIRLSRSNVQLLPLTVSPHCRRTVFVRWCLLPSRRVAVDVASVDVRLTVSRGCASLFAHRAVVRLVVRGCGFGRVGPACSFRVRRRVSVMVLLLSQRRLLVTAAVNVCLSVGRWRSFTRDVNMHHRRLMHAACRLAVVAPIRAN